MEQPAALQRSPFMSLITVIVVLIVVGLLLWLVSQLPIDATIQRIIHVVVIVAVVLWLLQAFTGAGPLGAIRIG